jgi:hypothetical protein
MQTLAYDAMIAELELMVIERAARRASLGQPVDVSLSAETVADPTVLEHAIRSVRRYRASPWLITFRVGGSPQARLLADRLDAVGFRVATV